MAPIYPCRFSRSGLLFGIGWTGYRFFGGIAVRSMKDAAPITKSFVKHMEQWVGRSEGAEAGPYQTAGEPRYLRADCPKKGEMLTNLYIAI